MELQFSDWQSSVQSFPSTWKRKRETVNNSMQTEDVLNEDKAVQSTAIKHAEMQTVTEEERPFSREEFEKLPPSLFAFFSRVTDSVCQNLQQNLDPFAAEVFQDIGDENLASTNVEAKKEYTLRSDSVPQDFVGKCLAWSKAGTQIAVGYSFPNHDGWCTHKAPVSSWNIRRAQNFHENIPTAEIFLPSCICCMDFHPLDSSILAVGLFTGEVVLVDLFSIEKGSVSGYSANKMANNDNAEEWTQKGDATNIVADFGYTSYSSGHNCQVVTVKWIRLTASQYSDILESGRVSKENLANQGDPASTSNHCCLLSSSKDGYICLWSTNRANNRLKLVKKFIVWADNLPEEVKIGNRNVNGMKEIGITGLSCCKDDPFAFIFSTFGSYLFQGNLQSEIEAYEAEAMLHDSMASVKDTLFSLSPVLLGQYEGYIIAVDCSPYHRNVFLTATSDGRVYLKNLLQPEISIKKLFASEDKTEGEISDVQWSLRPMMFGVSIGNTVKIFDLTSCESSVATIQNDSHISKLAFNKAESTAIAVADEAGFVHIWKLPSKIASQNARETELFMDLIKTDESS